MSLVRSFIFYSYELQLRILYPILTGFVRSNNLGMNFNHLDHGSSNLYYGMIFNTKILQW